MRWGSDCGRLGAQTVITLPDSRFVVAIGGEIEGLAGRDGEGETCAEHRPSGSEMQAAFQRPRM